MLLRYVTKHHTRQPHRGTRWKVKSKTGKVSARSEICCSGDHECTYTINNSYWDVLVCTKAVIIHRLDWKCDHQIHRPSGAKNVQYKNTSYFLTDSPHWSRQFWPPQQLECKEALNNITTIYCLFEKNLQIYNSLRAFSPSYVTSPDNTLTTQKISPYWPSLFVLTVWDWHPYVLPRNFSFVWHLNTNLPEDDTECHTWSNNQELRVQFGLDWWSTWDLFPLSHSSLVYSLFSTKACSFSVFRWGNSPTNVPIWNSSVAWWVHWLTVWWSACDWGMMVD